MLVLKFFEETDFSNGGRWHSFVFRVEPNLLHGNKGSCTGVLAFVYYSICPWLPFDQPLKPHVQRARRERCTDLHRPFQFSNSDHILLAVLASRTVEGQSGRGRGPTPRPSTTLLLSSHETNTVTRRHAPGKSFVKGKISYTLFKE